MYGRAGCCLLVAAMLASGCSKRSQVAEISVVASGVELHDLSGQLPPGWLAWRGPQGNGIAADQELPVTWSETEHIRWRADVPGRGHASPVVVGDLVLLATADETKQQQLVVAFDRSNGQESWRRVVHAGGLPSAREVHSKGTHANGTVACDGQRIYVAFFNADHITATALDLAGQIVWQQELGSFDSKFGFAPSPVLYKSFVIFAVDHQGGGYLVAVDGQTGQIAWRVAREAKNSHSTPLLAELGGRTQLLISGLDQVASYDPATGELKWSTPCTSETTCGTMVSNGDFAFAAGGYPDKQTVCLSADGKLVWENRTKVYEPSMLVAGDLLFAVSDDGIAYCWNAADGKLHWRQRLGGNFSASPVLCNGLIYVSNLSGRTWVFRAIAEGFEQVAVNQLGSDCYASPAISQNQIFLRIGVLQGARRQEQLVCIGE